MWPKEMFDLKRNPNMEEKLKQMIAEKSNRYFQDYVKDREILVDK
jgi:hypothetical protein